MLKHALIRNTFFLSLCLTGVGLGSCKKEVTQVVDQGFSAIYTVKSSDWKGSPTYLSTTLNVPELDQIIQDHGGVSVYLSLDKGVTYEALPQVVENVAYGSYHQTGLVGVDLQPADNTGTITAPSGDVKIKVVLLD
jgi:hypothetical protein